MSWGVVILLVLSYIAIWLISAIYAARLMFPDKYRNSYDRIDGDDLGFAVFVCLFWPITMVAGLGMLFCQRIGKVMLTWVNHHPNSEQPKLSWGRARELRERFSR